jgi:hypothetical protein
MPDYYIDNMVKYEKNEILGRAIESLMLHPEKQLG